jgi:hypothetical protein
LAEDRDDFADDAGVGADRDVGADLEAFIVVEVSGGDDVVAASQFIDVHARAGLSEIARLARRYLLPSKKIQAGRNAGPSSDASTTRSEDAEPVADG